MNDDISFPSGRPHHPPHSFHGGPLYTVLLHFVFLPCWHLLLTSCACTLVSLPPIRSVTPRTHHPPITTMITTTVAVVVVVVVSTIYQLLLWLPGNNKQKTNKNKTKQNILIYCFLSLYFLSPFSFFFFAFLSSILHASCRLEPSSNTIFTFSPSYLSSFSPHITDNITSPHTSHFPTSFHPFTLTTSAYHSPHYSPLFRFLLHFFLFSIFIFSSPLPALFSSSPNFHTCHVTATCMDE